MKKHHKFSIWYILLGIWFVILLQNYIASTYAVPTIPYSQFITLLQQGKIGEVAISSNQIQGKYKPPHTGPQGATEFKTVRVDPNLSAVLQNYRVVFKGEIESTLLRDVISWIFPIVLFVGVWFFLMKRMGGQQAGFMTLGKNKAKIYMENELNVNFNDVAGVDEAKQELVEVIEFLKEPKKFINIGAKIPTGVLLMGPPGTGKTLLARAIAGEAGVPFFSISGSDFVEMFVGVGASRVRDLFDQGKKSAPCIIFIDEIDAVGRLRGAGLGGGHDEREQTLNQLLVEMDGFETNEGVIIIAATNRPDVLDPALLRPGRFDREVVVDIPDVKGREKILAVHSKKIPLSREVDLKIIARGTPGFTGADLANLVNESALLAARRGRKRVTMEDMEDAKDKVLMGPERRSILISDKEKEITAYHEGGHAILGVLTGSDPVHKVTIIPRGRALGVTMQLPKEDRRLYSKKHWLDQITVLFGGHLAEEMKFKEVTTGSSSDLERASDIARKMVCEWGMSEKLGPITFGKRNEQIFLGREISQHRDYSETTAQLIDEEVNAIIDSCKNNAMKLLKKNMTKLDRLAQNLIERETLTGEEINTIMAGQKLPPVHNHDEKSKPSAAEKVTAETPETGEK